MTANGTPVRGPLPGEQPLRCADGAFHGALIDGRYLRVPCRKGRTRTGERHDHLFDLVTGEDVPLEVIRAGRVSRQEDE